MIARKAPPAALWIVRAFVAVGCFVFLATAFRTGWTRLSTDFPNYYTAAVAVRQHQPLRDLYDWTWFARHMNYAGIENQLGAYNPQPPLSMLPMLPLAGFPAQTAKRIWLIVNLALLVAIVAMLAKLSGIRWEYIAALLLCGFRSLQSNFVYGQYYIFLLFLIVLMFAWLDRDRNATAGFLSGVAFGLKLYTGPFLLYFAARRKWAALLGMAAGAAAMGAVAVARFGWSDCTYYITHVLPRALEGGFVDPYTPEASTFSTFLRRNLVAEPELNPNPAFNAPWLFFFGHSAMQLAIAIFATLGLAFSKERSDRRGFSWFVIILILLSTNTSSYTFILLLAPIVLLLSGTGPWTSIYLSATYILLNLHLQPLVLFPKVWLLIALFIVAGAAYLRSIPRAWAISAAVVVLMLSLADAQRHMAAYRQEPGHRYPQVAVEPGALFSGFPAITRAGLFYQGMGDYRQGISRYVIRWSHDNRIDSLVFDGNALRPFALSPDRPIYFELVKDRVSTVMQFDPTTRITSPAPAFIRRPGDSVLDHALSPDGKWEVFTRITLSAQQLWLKNTATGESQLLAGGNCDNSNPVWELNSSAVIFASDCDRSAGLPALYRAAMEGF